MDTKSRLLTLDLWLISEIKDEYLSVLDQYVHKNFNVMNTAQFKFEPEGLTRVYILSESHFAIHTYPECNYLSIDLFICNAGIDLGKVKSEIINMMPVLESQSDIKTRGVKNLNSLSRDRKGSELGAY